eukprot:954329-Pyramimonas_sp.AAC.1
MKSAMGEASHGFARSAQAGAQAMAARKKQLVDLAWTGAEYLEPKWHHRMGKILAYRSLSG